MGELRGVLGADFLEGEEMAARGELAGSAALTFADMRLKSGED